MKFKGEKGEKERERERDPRYFHRVEFREENLSRQIRKETGKSEITRNARKKGGSREELNAINHRAMSRREKQMDDDEAAKRKRTKKKKGKTKKEGTFLADFTEARAQPAPVQESFGGIYGPPQFLTQRENNHHGGTWHEIPLSSLSHPLLSFLEITVVISSDGRSPG